MRFIEFDKSLCDSCYKCLRGCPTKAISFNGSTREIVDDLCMKCGLCQVNCPQQALTIANPINRILSAIKSNKKTAVSIAPSYVGAFDMDDSDIIIAGALKKLGFDYIEETSVGAQLVFERYKELLKDYEIDNVITTCCPAANYLIESHYPELIGNMLPVVSPMIAHGRYMKEKYSDDCFVVFIGPCLAKMAEAGEINESINAVITFDELQKWFDKENIVIDEQLAIPFDEYGTKIGKAYPIKVNPTVVKGKKTYRYIKVDGVNQCKTILEELRNNAIKNCLIELNICEGGCINGPEMPKNNKLRYQREMILLDNVEKHKDISSEKSKINNVNLDRSFKSRRVKYEIPNKESLNKIMRQMGKYTEHDELNCGACGYATCYEKAIAVFQNRSEAHNCMAYLRDKAESMHSNMVENSPNAICTINNDLIITEYNPSFDEIFNDKNVKIIGLPIGYFADETLISDAMENKKSIKAKKIYEKYVSKHFIINIIYYEPEDIAHVFFTDITANELKKEELENVKKETLLRTQEVIDKQMRVAQEIAGLLGETTAETKMSLKSLRDLLLSE